MCAMRDFTNSPIYLYFIRWKNIYLYSDKIFYVIIAAYTRLKRLTAVYVVVLLCRKTLYLDIVFCINASCDAVNNRYSPRNNNIILYTVHFATCFEKITFLHKK